jgi:hypothetical protein
MEKALAVLVVDCLESPGDAAMILPMLKAALVLATDEELKQVAGGPRVSNESAVPAHW